MKILDAWRSALRPLIPRGFLRRDQGEGLLISDYPRHGDAEAISREIETAGFSVFVENGLARIDGTGATYEALLRNFEETPDFFPGEKDRYLYALAKRLALAETPWEQQDFSPIRLTLKCVDAGEWDTLEEKLPPMIALLQRKHRPLPAAAGWVLLWALKEKGENAC